MSYGTPIYTISPLGAPIAPDLGIPPSPAPPQITPEQIRVLGKDILFDGNFRVTSARDYVVLSGKEALRQAVLHRLLTRPGEFAARPTYGVGIQRFVKRRNIPGMLLELQETVRDQLSLEPRIDEVLDVAVERSADGRSLNVGIRVSARGQRIRFRPFNFPEVILLGDIAGSERDRSE